MYGILRHKDLDQKLADLLDDNNLKAINCVNRYYTRVLDDEYYKRRFRREIKYDISNMNINKEPWKTFYFKAQKYLQDEDHVNVIRLLVLGDHADILQLVYEKYSYQDKETIYGWNSKTKDYTNPLTLTIEHDRAKCFQYLYELQNPLNCSTLIISYHAHKILKTYVSKLDENLKAVNAYHCFDDKCMECYDLLDISSVPAHKILNVLYQVDLESIGYFISQHSRPLQKFMDGIPRSDLIFYKEEALQRNRMDIVKLLTTYTSPFSKFKT